MNRWPNSEHSKMAPLLVTFAVKEEAYAFQKLAGSRVDLRVLLTGIGQRNAEEAVRIALAGESPRLVLTCGFAGGLNPELATGTVVFSVDENLTSATNPPATPLEGSQSSGARGHFPSWEGSGVGSEAQNFATQRNHLASFLLAAGARPARFQCVERVVTTATEKRALRRETGADAVEMESDIIRFICCEYNIPSATVRVISDAADKDLPLDFNRLMDADQNLSYGKLSVALLKSPGKIGALLEFQKQTQAAAENLARVLMKVISNRTQAPL
jgi:nucleoside phosphorylase